MAGQRERDPAGGIRQVRAEVVGMRRPRGGQPEEERQRGPAGRGDPEREAGEGAEADPDLRDRDQEPEKQRERLADLHERRERRDAGEVGHLGHDRRGAGGIEERRVDELVDAGVEERDPEEEAEGQQRARRHGGRPELVAQRRPFLGGSRRRAAGVRRAGRCRSSGRRGSSARLARRSTSAAHGRALDARVGGAARPVVPGPESISRPPLGGRPPPLACVAAVGLDGTVRRAGCRSMAVRVMVPTRAPGTRRVGGNAGRDV